MRFDPLGGTYPQVSVALTSSVLGTLTGTWRQLVDASQVLSYAKFGDPVSGTLTCIVHATGFDLIDRFNEV